LVKKHEFNTEQGAYLGYLHRWKVGHGEEPKRIHFDAFLPSLLRLSEVSFYLIALKNDGKTRGGQYPKLVREQADLTALLLIKDEEKGDEETP